MNISNPTLVLLLGGISALSASASADVFNPRFAVTEIHSRAGANTSSPFAAAAVMGMQGYSNTPVIPGWESTLTVICSVSTGSSQWPSACNPAGMASTMASFSATSWVAASFLNSDQASALAEIVTAVQAFGSPALVPAFGLADHWFSVNQITATLASGVWTIAQVRLFDGGPLGQTDSGFNEYEAGTLILGGSVWRNIYFRPISLINPSCDQVGCTSDPYYNRYVVVFDPPVGQTAPPIAVSFTRSPGVLGTGERAMSPALAQARVWSSLTAAAVDRDADLWRSLRAGAAGAALEVNAVGPSGTRWDYYLVPILTSPHSDTAIGFVQLATDDGSLDALRVPTASEPFVPVTEARAEQVAASVLAAGETLGAGILTWDSRANTGFVKSPTKPYYEFPILDARGRSAGVVRVPLVVAKPVRGS